MQDDNVGARAPAAYTFTGGGARADGMRVIRQARKRAERRGQHTIDRFIGNTPLVRLERVVESDMAEVWVKPDPAA